MYGHGCQLLALVVRVCLFLLNEEGSAVKRRFLYMLLCFGLIFPSVSWSQIDRTELNGTVTDASGAVVTGTLVTVIQEGTNQVRIIRTDARGQYVVSSLPIGRFSIVFSRDGFQETRVSDVDLHSGDVRTVNAKLTIGVITETVGVEADTEGAQLTRVMPPSAGRFNRYRYLRFH
jgi:hypothetical protein